LTVKGQRDEDAMLCTEDKTYTVRSVVLSNSMLVVAPHPERPSDTIIIRDQLNEILELVPSVPKLHKLGGLLRGMEYDEGQEDGDVDNDRDCEMDGEGQVSSVSISVLTDI
jgi:sister chromatid cohesion protein DCC1